MPPRKDECDARQAEAGPSTSACRRTSGTIWIVASAYPQNAGYNPTGTVGALAFWAADTIRNKYLQSQGPLVQT